MLPRTSLPTTNAIAHATVAPARPRYAADSPRGRASAAAAVCAPEVIPMASIIGRDVPEAHSTAMEGRGDRSRRGSLLERRPDVVRRRPDQAVVAHLLEDVRRPAGHARDGEGRREELARDADPLEDDRGPELHVGVERAIRLRGAEALERPLLDVESEGDARSPELAGGGAEARGARVL